MFDRVFGVYIMASDRPTLYIGMTNHLGRRIHEHRIGEGSVFTKRYKLNKCVYYEYSETARQAIIREKQLKHLHRAEKLKMIKEFNPAFKDLGDELIELFGC